MFNSLKHKILDWCFQRAARQVFQRGLGFARERWPIQSALSADEREHLRTTVSEWYQAQLANTATPYGINDYGAILRLICLQQRRTILWECQPPMFQRREAAKILDHLVTQIAQLPIDLYPQATHIEAHLVSVGNILIASDRSA
jgi:hypothetical protein